MTSDSSVTDGVIRAVKGTLSEAGIELAVPLIGVKLAAPTTSSHGDDMDPATDGPAPAPDEAEGGS
jgi:hypothetical protein